MSKKYVLGADDETPVILPDGTVLDGVAAEAFAEQKLAAARRRGLIPGRKSLSGGTTHSPVVHVRLPEQLRDEIQSGAASRGISVSRYTRELLEKGLRAS